MNWSVATEIDYHEKPIESLAAILEMEVLVSPEPGSIAGTESSVESDNETNTG